MTYETISCRLAIQVCIGYSPNGRARHRTFSMKGIRPGASGEAIDAIIRALAPLLIYPITKVRKVTKRTIFFNDSACGHNTAPVPPAGAVPEPKKRAHTGGWRLRTGARRRSPLQFTEFIYRSGGNLPPAVLVRGLMYMLRIGPARAPPCTA